MPQGVQALLALLILLPGFVSARVARSISAPSTQTDTERIIDALIFSFFIYLLYLFLFGGVLPFNWSSSGGSSAGHVNRLRLFFLCFAPVVLGVIWGALQHRDAVLGPLRSWNITDRTNAVSVWNGTLKALSGTVQVGLADGREVVGWLQQYSDTVEERSLFLTRAAWVAPDGARTEVPGAGILLTDKAEIRYIMFLGEAEDRPEIEVHS